MKKFILVALMMLAVFAALFLIAEELGYTDATFVQEKIQTLHDSPNGKWVVAMAVVVLLGVDLVLPVPSSLVMAASGMFLGSVLGGVVASVGAMLAALLGYGLCRLYGQRAMRKLVSEEEITGVTTWFDEYGVIAIIISRPVPMLTEVLSCLAGLSGLRFSVFMGAAALGTLPICFIYSYVGSLGDMTDPWPMVGIALVVPALGWIIARRVKASGRVS